MKGFGFKLVDKDRPNASNGRVSGYLIFEKVYKAKYESLVLSVGLGLVGKATEARTRLQYSVDTPTHEGQVMSFDSAALLMVFLKNMQTDVAKVDGYLKQFVGSTPVRE